MSEKIDWSKAPEGADRYNTYNNLFYKDAQPGLQVFTRGQWEQSVFVKSDECFVCRPTAQSWSGEGLPPVGVVCVANGYQVVIVAHHCNGIHAIYAESESDGLLYYGEPNEFRHIRTPEQIAADEREQALREACEVVGCAPGSMYGIEVVKKLIDAGYRKP